MIEALQNMIPDETRDEVEPNTDFYDDIFDDY
jgi:hypothetical protein